MSELILDCALDALKDGALSIPILFLAYLLMEMLENSKRLDEGILHSYSRKAGPRAGRTARRDTAVRHIRRGGNAVFHRLYKRGDDARGVLRHLG